MIYRVVLDNVEDIHTQDNPLLNPSLELEMNSAGSFKFMLPPMHPAWDEVKVLKTTVDIFEGEDLIFTGRVANIDKNWNNERVVECEGALAFFNDSVQRQMKWENPIKISEFLTDILNNHNTQVPDNRKIYLGNVTITDSYVTREVDYEMTLDILTRMCIDTNGGWFMIRKDLSDNKLYLDWFEDFTNESDQPVQFGLNLLDFSSGIHAEDICTGVLAKGATVNDQVVMLNNVELVDEDTYPDLPVSHYTDRDQDILWHREGVETYGKVLQVKEFSDAQTDWKDGQGQIVENSLFELAKKWLVEKNTKVETIEVEAAELAWLGSGYPTFQLGTLVELNDSPHISESIKLPMYKISLSLDDGAKKITLGTPPKKELTQISASNSDSNTLSTGSSSSGSGSGGGGTECLVQDVWVNGVSVVSGKIARVTVPTDTVTQSQMNTAINAAVAPKANTSDVNTALALKANTVDVTNALALKADKSEIIDVEANPSESATDDLNTIKIGDTVYDIPGGGGSGGSGQDYECDLLFENDPLPSPQSTPWTQNYVLNASIDDYDAIYLIACTDYQISGTLYPWTPSIVFKGDYYNASIQISGSYTDGRLLNVQFSDSTHVTATGWGSGSCHPVLYKVYGLKFKSSIDIFSPQIYSEEEKVVGVWTDGKPLYQKTFIWTNTELNQWVYHDVSDLNIDTIVDIKGWLNRINAGAIFIHPIGYEERLNNNYSAQCRYSGISNTIDVWNALPSGNSSDQQVITIQYTKTTDTVGSSHWLSGGVMAVNYTEEEQIIGQWMGKTLYQKTIDCGSISITGTTTISHNIDNLERAVTIIGNCINNSGVMFPIPLVQSGDIVNYQIRVSINNTSISLSTVSVTDISSCYVTIQYTKTTDTAGNPMANILATQKELEEIAYHYRDHCYTTLSDYYSTEERVVGRWTDGKPLYQKSIAFDNSSTQDLSIDVSSLNIDKFCNYIFVTGTAVQGYNQAAASGSYMGSGDYLNAYLNTISGSELHIRRGGNWFITANGIITIQYTKTTDAVGTGPTPGNLIYLPALYSEEEREVGVWTDGKPLYQKTIDCGALPNATSKEISSGLTNENVVNWFGYSLRPSDGTMFHLPYCQSFINNQHTGQITATYSNDTHKLIIYTAIDRSDFTETKITLQYTKTTDTPGSGKYLPDGQYAHHYSTSEKVVGTWIDGSTIYERTWDFGSSPISIAYNSWTSIGITISNFGRLIHKQMLGGSDGEIDISGAGIELKVNSDGTVYAEYNLDTNRRVLKILTLQYTKTS